MSAGFDITGLASGVLQMKLQEMVASGDYYGAALFRVCIAALSYSDSVGRQVDAGQPPTPEAQRRLMAPLMSCAMDLAAFTLKEAIKNSGLDESKLGMVSAIATLSRSAADWDIASHSKP